MKLQMIIVIFQFVGLLATAQSNISINGYLKDQSSGEVLIGASVTSNDEQNGTITNEYGYYSLQVRSGEIELHYSYVGFEEVVKTINLNRDTIINVELYNNALAEVTVIAKKKEIASNGLNRLQMPTDQLARLPSIGGETDIFKALLLLPGVSGGQEGTTNLYIRGGTPDQNLILLDGIPVYNASHLGGYFSVFNADAINNIEIIRGGIPANYGGRLSSVIDITMREGNNKEFKGRVGAGILASYLTLEGPLKKGKSSYLFASRISYLGLINLPKDKKKEKDYFDYWLYDINFKTNYQLGKGNLYVSCYTNNDVGEVISNDFIYKADTLNTKYLSNSNIQWGNTTLSTRYVVPLSSKLFIKFLLGYTQYRYSLESNEENTTYTPLGEFVNKENYINGSKVEDWIGRVDFAYNFNSNHYLKFGITSTAHTYTTNSSTPPSGDVEETMDSVYNINNKFFAQEYALYFQDDIQWTDKWSTQIGLRWDLFKVNKKFYNKLQPRINLEYQLSDRSSFFASFAITQQYIHLLQNDGFGLPNDIWVPATDKTPPQQAYQASLGASLKLTKNLSLVMEGYYKRMDNLIDYKVGLDEKVYNEIGDWEKLVELNGRGESYGLEFLFQKEKGKFKGYLAYTLSWNFRTFENINEGNPYPFTYDRRHDIAIFLQYQLSKKWMLSGNWVFNTGTAVTLPVANAPFSETDRGSNGTFRVLGEIPDPDFRSFTSHFIFDGKNNSRMPSYHRMDVGLEHKRKTKNNNYFFWKFSVYNLYNRRNPSYLTIEGGGTSYTEINGVGEVKVHQSRVVQKSLFSFIPGLSMEYKF